MELISRDEVMRLAESGKLLSGSFGERAKDITVEAMDSIMDMLGAEPMGTTVKKEIKPNDKKPKE